VLFAIIPTSCKTNRDLVGLWQGQRNWKESNLDNEAIARALAAIDLDLKANGSFILHDNSINYNGSWVQSGESVDLRVDTIMNRPLERQPDSTQKQSVFSIRARQGSLYFKDTTDREEIELKKKAQP
jgi:hypothetical protein